LALQYFNIRLPSILNATVAISKEYVQWVFCSPRLSSLLDIVNLAATRPNEQCNCYRAVTVYLLNFKLIAVPAGLGIPPLPLLLSSNIIINQKFVLFPQA